MRSALTVLLVAAILAATPLALAAGKDNGNQKDKGGGNGPPASPPGNPPASPPGNPPSNPGNPPGNPPSNPGNPPGQSQPPPKTPPSDRGNDNRSQNASADHQATAQNASVDNHAPAQNASSNATATPTNGTADNQTLAREHGPDAAHGRNETSPSADQLAREDRKDNRTDAKDAHKDDNTEARDARKENQTEAKDARKENQTAAKDARKENQTAAKAEREDQREARKDVQPSSDPAPPTHRDGAVSGPSPPAGQPKPDEVPVALAALSKPGVVVDEASDGAPARGEVHVRARDRPAGQRATLVLVGPDGDERPLGDADGAAWNTSAYPNGDYTIQLREQKQDGSNVTIASTRVIVQNPRASPGVAVAALATGAAVSAATSAAASSSLGMFDALRQSAQQLASDVAENRARVATANVAALRRARLRSGALLLAAAALLTFFKLYAERPSWAELRALAPVAGSAIGAAVLLCAAVEWSIARAAGGHVRYKLWMPGAISLGLSSVLFGSAFGYPGFVDELPEEEQPSKRALAGRAAGVLAATLGLALPFVAVGLAWRWDFAEYGLAIILMAAAASALPFAPYPGQAIWRWSRLAWLSAFALFASIELLWQLAILPPTILLLGAALGLVGYGAALRISARAAVEHA